MDKWKLNLALFTEQADPNKTTDSGMSAEMKIYYEMELLHNAEPKLLYDSFAKRKPIPKGRGKTIEFRRWSTLPKALSPLTEGVTPTGSNSSVSYITATIAQYGDYVRETDLLDLTAIDDVILQDTQMLGRQAGKTLDTVTREVICGGSNVSYADKDTAGTLSEITSRADLSSDCVLKRSDVVKAVAKLKAMDAPTIGNEYVAIIHPYVSADLQLSSETGGWIDVNKYTDPQKIYNGEIGKLAGVRFVESTEAKIVAPSEFMDGINRLTVKTNTASNATVPVNEAITEAQAATLVANVHLYVGGEEKIVASVAHGGAGEATITFTTAQTVTAGDMICGMDAGKDGSAVFLNMIIGDEAYATTELEGGGLQHFVKQLGAGEDPLNQRSSIGWKATKVAKILNDAYMVRLESGSSYSAEAESN